jgi:hypothetical protein
MKLRKGDKWIINKYNGYTISNNGNITVSSCTNLSYEITDIKKTNIKNNYMIGFKISYVISGNLFIEYHIALYNTENRKALILESPVNGDSIGLDKLQILCNGNLRVKFFEASGLVYIADLKKVQYKN